MKKDANNLEPVSEVAQKKQSPVADIIKVSLPVTLSQYLMTLGGFLSVFLLSFLGTNVFAASMLISSTQLLLMTVPFAILFCVSPMISHFVGAKKDLLMVGVFFRASLLLSFLIGLVIMLVLANIKPILLAFHQPAALVEICTHYFKIFMWVVPFSALSRACFQVALGLFKQKFVFLLSFGSLIFFVLAAYVLIFGHLGLHAMGVEGLAIAYILQSMLNLALILYYFYKEPSLAVYQLFNFKCVKGFWSLMNKILKTGTPISLQMGNELLSFFITTILVGWLGATALMAKQITAQYLLLLVIPIFGIGQASATFVGKFYGEKKLSYLKQYGNVSIAVGVIYSMIALILFAVIPKPFIDVFVHGQNAPAEFYKLVSILLVIVTAGQVFDSIRSIAAGALRGLGDTRYPLYVSVVGIWIFGLPLAYLFGFTFHWGLIGIAMAHNVFSVLGAFILWLRWHKLATITMAQGAEQTKAGS